MEKTPQATMDGNEAAAHIAHLCNEVIAIYPITPASPMGEWADAWSSQGQTNIWGSIPEIIEMQSEAGAAGAIHGALQAGAITTTFTASQGLLLMIPNMYKIAGELTPTVFHIAARSLACQALSIFGDHSDVMAARSTGFAMLSSNSPQEVMDMALIAQISTLNARIPVLHFFDGFRTSHELQKIERVTEEMVRKLIPTAAVHAHRQRSLSPDHPVLRGSSQNPDVYFQARETVNPYYQAMPALVQQAMDSFAAISGRQYRLFDYFGSTEATAIIILMGSGAETAEETVEYLLRQGEKIGVLKVRLYRPFDADALIAAIPASVLTIAVLDRTKEPGADGEPLYKDIVTAVYQYYQTPGNKFSTMPVICGGRYGLSSKEFTPGMIKAVFDNLKQKKPRQHFTIGIHDDVSHCSLDWDSRFRTDANANHFQAIFYGLGSDGTVSANKNTIKIIAEATDLHGQGYFVYDSKKSGAVTVSHLRFGSAPIHSTYLIGDGDANFIACHQPVFLQRYPMLDKAAEQAVFLLNSPASPDQVWDSLPTSYQQIIISRKLRLYSIDAYAVADMTGMGKRINTIMQTCFFAISGVLPKQQSITAIKDAVKKSYGSKGKRIVELNYQAIDETLKCLHEIKIPAQVTSTTDLPPTVVENAPDHVKQFTAEIMAGRGDLIPVSKLPADGTFPLGTAAYEKRNLALEIPVWEPELCTQCGKCPLVCPHGVIRCKVYDDEALSTAPASFKSMPTIGKLFPQSMHMSYQVSAEDCTGCGLCVDICPIHDKSNISRKALNMVPATELIKQERENWDFFLQLPEYDRNQIKQSSIRGAMILQPLFEFSGACEGCGETPYLKLASQLFGDRMLVANATGCSSIYGGNLPTTPWTTNADGRGPAWSNSLFEDNAEFGLGMRLAVDIQRDYARQLLNTSRTDINDDNLVDAILDFEAIEETDIFDQRQRLDTLRAKLLSIDNNNSVELQQVIEYLNKKSVWIIGGDGWAYDIGYGGLDHVLTSGRDVNILVLDTEVYSNTGGQTSKATPLGAVAKFSAGGKSTAKKDLAMLAISYENVYVAHIAYGAKDTQTLHAFLEAEAHRGPSLIIAYSPCIAHGVDLKNNHRQQQLAVNSGHWPLFRFNPGNIALGKNPLHLDSQEPSIPYREFIETETRFNMLWRTSATDAERYLKQAQKDVMHRYQHYKQLSELEWNTASNAGDTPDKRD